MTPAMKSYHPRARGHRSQLRPRDTHFSPSNRELGRGSEQGLCSPRGPPDSAPCGASLSCSGLSFPEASGGKVTHPW